MVGPINQCNVQNIHGRYSYERMVEHIDFKILNVLNARTIMIYALLTNKKVAVYS